MTNEYRKSSHTVFNIQLHISWITKYRYKVLTKEVGQKAKDLIRRICNEENIEILSGAVSPDHIHILVSINPSTSVSNLVNISKEKLLINCKWNSQSLEKNIGGSIFGQEDILQ